MTEALLFLAIGIAIAIASALLLHVTARKCRTAPNASVWRTESLATLLSLGLVALIVISAALTIKATITIMPEAIGGIAVGMLAVLGSMFVTLRLAGRLPALADEAPPTVDGARAGSSANRTA